ncbi:hypothetical protein WJX74_004112 [Apatococcus lobatus]|uniref:Uncharacterized protein n=1 Tax=Apatococcus lobatus TaxID=904363 RepID=A0AAW1Q7X8_9CHLO
MALDCTHSDCWAPELDSLSIDMQPKGQSPPEYVGRVRLSRQLELLVFSARCDIIDALAGPALPITAAAFLLALLHSARDQAEIQLRNTAIQALQPPRNSAGRNPRTSTRFWERDVFVPGSNNRQFRGNFRVPVFQAFAANAPPVNPSDYLPSQSEAFDATWVPRYMAGVGPLRTPSFTLPNPDGVISIPRSAYVTIDASGPDVLLTAQLTGGAFVWAYDSVNRVLYAAHINPRRQSLDPEPQRVGPDRECPGQ